MNTRKLTPSITPAMRLVAFITMTSLSIPALAGIILRLDGNDYGAIGSSFITTADRTIHVLSDPNVPPLACSPQGTPQGNAATSLTLRLDYVNIPLSANVDISLVSGNTLITATSTDGVLVCNPNTNDLIYQQGFE